MVVWPSCETTETRLTRNAWVSSISFETSTSDRFAAPSQSIHRHASVAVQDEELLECLEDIKYLKAPAKIMRRLFPKTSKTVYQAMTELFKARNQTENKYLIQDSETTFHQESSRRIEQIEFGYSSVWLKTWRQWTELVLVS